MSNTQQKFSVILNKNIVNLENDINNKLMTIDNLKISSEQLSSTQKRLNAEFIKSKGEFDEIKLNKLRKQIADINEQRLEYADAIKKNERIVTEKKKELDDSKLQLTQIFDREDISKELTKELTNKVLEDKRNKKKEDNINELTEKINKLNNEIKDNERLINNLSIGNFNLKKDTNTLYKLFFILVIITITIIVLGSLYNNMIFIGLIPAVCMFVYFVYKIYNNHKNIDKNTMICSAKVKENNKNQENLKFYNAELEYESNPSINKPLMIFVKPLSE